MAHRREAEKGLSRKGKSTQFAQRWGEEGPEHRLSIFPLLCHSLHHNLGTECSQSVLAHRKHDSKM